MSYLYILDINPFLDILFANFFLPFSRLSFHFVNVSLAVQKFLSLIRAHLMMDREIGDGQGSLVCCNPWGHRESDMTE